LPSLLTTTVTFNRRQAMVIMVMASIHVHAKIKVKGQLIKKLEWKQTDGQTDSTDCNTLPVTVNAVNENAAKSSVILAQENNSNYGLQQLLSSNSLSPTLTERHTNTHRIDCSTWTIKWPVMIRWTFGERHYCYYQHQHACESPSLPPIQCWPH